MAARNHSPHNLAAIDVEVRGREPVNRRVSPFQGSSQISARAVAVIGHPDSTGQRHRGNSKTVPQIDPSAGPTVTVERSIDPLVLEGSTADPGLTYSSRFPLPLVSRTSAVQPCDLLRRKAYLNILAPANSTAPPPPPLLVHSVLFASSAKPDGVLKHVSMSVSSLVFGSYTPVAGRWS